MNEKMGISWNFKNSWIFFHEKLQFIVSKATPNALYTPQVVSMSSEKPGDSLKSPQHSFWTRRSHPKLPYSQTWKSMNLNENIWESHVISKIRDIFSMKTCNFLPRIHPQCSLYSPKLYQCFTQNLEIVFIDTHKIIFGRPDHLTKTLTKRWKFEDFGQI